MSGTPVQPLVRSRVALLRAAPSLERLGWIDRRFAVYVIALAIANGAFSIAGKFGWDFDIFWQTARDVASGHGAYDATLALGVDHWGPQGRTYVSPPVLAHLLAPVTALPEAVAFVAWCLLGAAAVAFAARALGPDATCRRLPRFLAGLGVLWIGLLIGQVNLFVLAGLMLVVGARDDRLAGAGLAIATLLRGTPAVFGLLLLLEGRWRAIGWAAIVGGVVALAAPFGEWSTYADMVRTLLGLPTVSSWWQASPAQIAGWLPLVATAAVAAVVLGAGRLPAEARPLRATALGLWLVLGASTAWFHWYAFALAPLYVDGHATAWGRRALVAFLVVGWLPIPIGSWAAMMTGSVLLAGLTMRVAMAWARPVPAAGRDVAAAT